MRIFHYTPATYLPEIIRDGVIRPAEPSAIGRERPIVWLSTNREWEHSVIKALPFDVRGMRPRNIELDRDGLEKQCGLGRIEVDPALDMMDWREIVRAARIRKKEARSMMRVAIGAGADPDEWRGTLEPIPSEHWLAVEAWDGKRWMPYDE